MTRIEQPADTPVAFEAAWNAHDMAAFGALFHPDASFVNRFGAYVRGAEDIVALHRRIHETIYRDSTLQNELIAVDPIGETGAIVHFWSRLSAGAAHPAGSHKVDTLLMTVVTSREGRWRIQAVENVALTDPLTGEARLRDRGPGLS